MYGKKKKKKKKTSNKGIYKNIEANELQKLTTKPNLSWYLH